MPFTDLVETFAAAAMMLLTLTGVSAPPSSRPANSTHEVELKSGAETRAPNAPPASSELQHALYVLVEGAPAAGAQVSNHLGSLVVHCDSGGRAMVPPDWVRAGSVLQILFNGRSHRCSVVLDAQGVPEPLLLPLESPYKAWADLGLKIGVPLAGVVLAFFLKRWLSRR